MVFPCNPPRNAEQDQEKQKREQKRRWGDWEQRTVASGLILLYQSNGPEFFMNEIVAPSITLFSIVPRDGSPKRVDDKAYHHPYY